MSKIITCPNCNAIFDMRGEAPPPPAPAPAPIPSPTPSGLKGSKTNPYKMNKTTSRVFNGYGAENGNDNAEVSIPANTKLYFEVDPSGIAFKLFIGFFSGGGTVCKLTQDITGAYSGETCQGSDGFFDIVRSPIANTKYLYAIDNSGSPGTANDKMWVQIPFVA
jgi:hypothetical protein